MKNLEKKDIKALDFIIDEVLVKRIVTTDDLIKAELIDEHRNEGFKLDVAYDPVKEFVRYLSIIKKYNFCHCSTNEDQEFARMNDHTLRFQKEGGFKELYEEYEEENKRKKLEYDLAKSNIEANKLNKKNEKRVRKMTWINIAIGVANLGLLVWQILKS